MVQILQHLIRIDCLSGFRVGSLSAQQLTVAVHLRGGDLLRRRYSALGLDRDKADFFDAVGELCNHLGGRQTGPTPFAH